MNTGTQANCRVAIAATSGVVLQRLIDEHLLARQTSIHSILLIGVAAEPGPLVATFAPMSGLVTPDAMRAFAIADAEKIARQALESVPEHVAVQYCVCTGWNRLPTLLATHGCQGAVVAEGDPSRRQLRAIRKSSSRLGIDLSLGGRAADAAPAGATVRAGSIPATATADLS